MGSWMNNDGLYLKFGTTKATPGTAGDFLSYGETRDIEFVISDLTTLTTTAAIIDDNTWVPANVIIESVQIFTDTAATSGGSATLSIGLMGNDRTTTVSDTAFVSALAFTAFDAAGETTLISAGSSGAGTKVGTTVGATTGYITAKYGTAVFTAGAIRVRIRYRGFGTITQ
jgi:hypothetical protein